MEEREALGYKVDMLEALHSILTSETLEFLKNAEEFGTVASVSIEGCHFYDKLSFHCKCPIAEHFNSNSGPFLFPKVSILRELNFNKVQALPLLRERENLSHSFHIH